MQRHDLALLEDLPYVLLLFMPFHDLSSTVGASISLGDHRMRLKLSLPVQRIVIITLGVITPLVSQLNILPGVTASPCSGDDMISTGILYLYVQTAQSTDTLEVSVNNGYRFRVVGARGFPAHPFISLLLRANQVDPVHRRITSLVDGTNGPSLGETTILLNSIRPSLQLCLKVRLTVGSVYEFLLFLCHDQYTTWPKAPSQVP